ncbi:MAG TPA: BatA domain-containing protein, partial [Alphaproteobacteria bacterium]|nr:BatA domain-containing protein [Alphaproteobacteria bacterium]
MLEIGLLGFAQPWLLAGLLALPALWWLLRLTPPPPRRVRFPAISLLLGLAAKEESAARMPWWLLALRMVIAALVILALAEPILAPQKMLKGEDGPIVVVVDNGWAAGPAWDERQATLGNLLDEAARSDRAVTVLPTARQAEALPEASFRPAEAWRAEIGAMGPRPWPVDRQAALDALQGVEGPAEAFWLADGLSGEGDEAFASRLQRLGRLTVMQPDARPLVLEEPEAMATGFGLQARRTSDQGPKTVTVEAVAEDGRVIAVQDVSFANGQTVAHTEWTLPNDLANQVRRLRVAQTAGAGSVVLLDDRWQQRSVGLAGAGADQAGHPLLDPSHYIDSALAEIARLRTGTLEELLEADPSLIITRQRLAPDLAIAVGLDEWLENGGVLVRFASPELAAEPDDWLPVRLRP